MKLKKHSAFFTAFFIILMCCNIVIADQSLKSSALKVPAKILIIPFKMHSEKDLSFLQNGIQDMLISRLTKEGEISPISKEISENSIKNIDEINEQVVVSLGEKFKADYVIYGSLTVFGSSISTDVSLFDISTKKTSLVFNDTGQNNGDVISHINQFAAQVNEKLTGGPQPSYVQPKVQKSKKTDESRRHPDTLWTEKKQNIENNAAPEDKSPINQTGAIWKSRNFKTEIKSIAIGDTDGDGQQEIAFMDDKDVFIYRYNAERFIKIGQIKGGVNDKLINIDIADINNNGKAEIFVTNLNTNKSLNSFVLEWSGTRFTQIVEKSKWYYRVLDVPGQGKILMGQKRSINKIFMPSIDQLQWSAGQYIAAQSQNLPKWINLYSFNFGDIMNNGQNLTAAFTKREYLRVLGPDGKEEWEGSEPFIGSAVFLEFRSASSSSIGEYKEQERLYLPQRILICDIDKDGKNEVIVGRNQDSARRLFARLRLYKGGHIECLAWDGFGLSMKWKTREISGHISDYIIGDINHDGKDELIFSVIKKTSSILGKAKSFIVSQEIN